MSEYKHGAYAPVDESAAKAAGKSQNAIIYVGTAPVNTVAGGAKNVNVPIAVSDITEAKRYFGYSDDYAGFTLCEAMYVHFEHKEVGPLVLINVFDPAVHKSETKGDISLTPENGRITIPDAESIILDSVVVASKEKGKDYTIIYNSIRKTIIITETTLGALGAAAVKITYETVDASKVSAADVIGASDGLGLNTGLYAVKNVYQLTGYIPKYLACPGFSSIPEVHRAMEENSVNVNKHWGVYMFVDLPIIDGEEPVTIDAAEAFKKTHGYTYENETVYYPLVQGVDGRKYHLSVLAAANFQKLLIENDGIPYMTASNTECPLIEGIYLGEAYKNRIYDDSIINDRLNKNGIASAAYTGGRWAIMGAHSADYNQDSATQINVAETNRMMLYYVSNDFQHRRAPAVDKPMSVNDLQSIRAQEQERLDALVKIGALVYGKVRLDMTTDARSDIVNGDWSFTFEVTATPLAKSLTANVKWTDKGFETYFASLGDQ